MTIYIIKEKPVNPPITSIEVGFLYTLRADMNVVQIENIEGVDSFVFREKRTKKIRNIVPLRDTERFCEALLSMKKQWQERQK